MNDMSWTKKKNVQGEPLLEIKMIIIIKWMAPHIYILHYNNHNRWWIKRIVSKISRFHIDDDEFLFL